MAAATAPKQRVRAAPIALPRWAVPVILAAIDIAIQLQIRPMPRFNDALMVMDFARRFPDAPATYRFVDVPVIQHELRIGMILPARAFQEIFGYGQVAFYAWPLLTGILLVLSTYWLAGMLFGRRAALVAGLIVMLHPILVRTTDNNTSWQLLPDVPAAALFTSGLALVVAAGRRLERSRSAMWWLAGAGICFGWAYLARELAALIFPTIVIALLLWRVPWRRWWAVAVPMLALLGLEMVLAWRIHGDALARWRTGALHTDPPQPHYTRADTLTGFWHMLEHNPGAPVMVAMMAVTLLSVALTRRRGFVLCATWCAWVLVPLLLAAGLADPHHVSLRVTSTRYWVPLLPPIAIGSAGALAALAGRRPAGLRAAAAVALAAGVLGLYAVHDARYIHRFAIGSDEAGLTATRWSALRAWLHAHGADIPAIASDGHTASTLDLMYRYAPLGGGVEWRGRVIVANRGPRWRPRPTDVGGAALLWSQYTSKHPPRLRDGWRLAWETDNRKLRLYAPAA